MYIEGDNLEVLKQLQKTYYGKIKMIYIDPPYNTGNDFVYKDDFRDSIDNYRIQTEQGLSSNPETNGRYHSDWLNMIYPRLILAKNLLSKDGVIFISIDDHEVDNLKKVCDEIFGEYNFIACLARRTKSSGKTTNKISSNHDYILIYEKTKNESKIIGLPHIDEGFKYEDEYVNERGRYKLNQTLDYDSLSYSPSLDYPIEIDGKTLYAGGSYEKYLERQSGNYNRADWAWRWSKDLFEFGLRNGFIVVKKGKDGLPRIYTKTYLNANIEKVDNSYKIVTQERTKALSSIEFIDAKYSNDNAKKDLLKIFKNANFDYPKPIELINTLLKIYDNPNALVLDFFSGSATTAHAVMKLNAEDGGNRKFIMVQLPEKCVEKIEAYKAGYKNICEIGKERIRRAGEQIKEEWIKENKGEGLFEEEKAFPYDIGFKVFKLDSTNIKAWDNDKELDETTLFDYSEVFKEGRSKEDIVYEIMLKYGVFDMQIKEIEVNGKTMYRIGKRYMIVCLEDEVTKEDIEAIADLRVKNVVFKESGFENDNDKINAVHNLMKAGVEDIKCI